MPTFHVCLTAPLLGSSATTVFCPLIAAYRVKPSGEYAHLAHQGGAAVHLRDRDAGRRTERAVGVDREPGHGVLLRKPEELAVRRVRRTFLTDAVVAQPLVDPGCGAGRPDELVARQVEDVQGHRAVGAAGREESPVRADRRAHELAGLGEQTVTERLDDLIAGDLDPVGVLGADLVFAKLHRRGVGHARAGEDDSRGAERDDARSAAGPAEDPRRPLETRRRCRLTCKPARSTRSALLDRSSITYPLRPTDPGGRDS